MNSFETALNLKFTTHNTGALLAVFTGNVMASGTPGLHWDIAPSECEPPYLVATVISSPATTGYGGVIFEEPRIMFKSFAVGRNVAIGNLETFIAAFDEFIPSLVANGAVRNVNRDDGITAMELPEEEVSGAAEYQAMTTYRYTLTP